jgi:hypothetical protein
MDRLTVERYKSLVRRQEAAIKLAERQIWSFHQCFTELGLAGTKIAEPQIADWLNEHHVLCSRRSGQWSAKTVGDRLFIDQRLQIEKTRDTGLKIAAMMDDEDDIHVFAHWHAVHSYDVIFPPFEEVARCINEFSENQRDYVNFVASQLRAGRTFVG